MLKPKQLLLLLRDVAIISVIALVFTEIAFRVYNKINPSFVFYDSSYNRFRGKPFADDYQFKLNSRGFKDVEFETEKAPGTLRILGIGDSFAFGVVPYDTNYYTRLEEMLNQSQQKPIELINMGIPNLNPKDYLSLFVEEGLKLNPDQIIVSFFVGNDFIDNQEKRSLDSYSYVATFVRYLIGLNTKYQGSIIHGSYVYKDDQATMNTPDYVKLQTARSVIFQKENQAFLNNLSYTIGFLEKMQEICNSRNIKMLVVIIPDETQVNPKLQDKIFKASNTTAEQYDFSLPNRLLTEEFRNRNIAYLDLLDPMKDKTVNQQTRLYKFNDTHWNIRGNEYAAELIDQHLTKTGL